VHAATTSLDSQADAQDVRSVGVSLHATLSAELRSQGQVEGGPQCRGAGLAGGWAGLERWWAGYVLCGEGMTPLEGAGMSGWLRC
jgi:hypothetical protein